jgi:hypothetical protein
MLLPLHARHRCTVGASVFAFAFLAACSSDTSLSPPIPSGAALSSAPVRSVQASQEFATALAMVLRSASARAELHRVLRASPYTRHKVHLQAWLHDPQAAKVTDGLAATMGKTPAELLSYVDGLQPLEIALPHRADRLNWRVSDGMSVLARLDTVTRSFVGATSTGQMLTYPSTKPQSEAVLAVRPLSALILRANPQPARASAVIQDSDDGEIGARGVTHLANGDSTVLQYAPFAKVTSGKGGKGGGADSVGIFMVPDDGGGGGGGGTLTPPMKLGRFIVVGVNDGNIGDTNEFRFEAHLFDNAGNQIEQRVTNVDDIHYTDDRVWNLPLLNGSPTKPFYPTGSHAVLIVYEDDGWLGRDDFFDGEIYSTDNVAGKSYINFPRLRGGDDRCGFDPDGTGSLYNCPMPEPDGSYWYWKQINFNLIW